MATGDSASVQRQAADIPIAGDFNNNIGPTYATFSKLATLNNDNPAADRTNQPVQDTIDKAGTVGTSADLGSKAKYVYFDSNLKHNIPDVFWNFMNQKGTIYQNSQISENQAVLGDNADKPWLDATGLPITEAYWANVTLAGVSRNVLIQAFERRVLTFTPDNPTAFQVEMGNVGRHYFNWRYDHKYDLTPTATTTPVVTATPTPTPTPVPSVDCKTASISDDTNGAYTYPRCGPAGMEIIIGMTVQAGEDVTIQPIAPDGSLRTKFTATASDKGIINEVFRTSTQSLRGQWNFKLHSLNSNIDAVVYVVVADPVNVPTVSVYPTQISIKNVIAFVIVGFKPGEQVTIMAVGPDNTSTKSQQVVMSDNGGGATVVFEPLKVAGNWTFTATAVSDKTRTASVNFTVTNE
jgi:hypothetical protein